MFTEFTVNIILIGFMGSGKSTVAKSLSTLLDRPWIEMDDLVYKKTNTQNMDEVFEKGGELLLRETEIAIAKEYILEKNLVISTGGGVVLNKIILDHFKKMGGKVIFLQASFDTIRKRLEENTSRPLFKHLTDSKKLYDFRLPLYLNYADKVIDVNALSADNIALKIKELLQEENLLSAF